MPVIRSSFDLGESHFRVKAIYTVVHMEQNVASRTGIVADPPTSDMRPDINYLVSVDKING